MANSLKSMKDTFLYKSMDKNGNYLTKMITTAMSKGRVLKYDELLYEVTNINKDFKYP